MVSFLKSNQDTFGHALLNESHTIGTNVIESSNLQTRRKNNDMILTIKRSTAADIDAVDYYGRAGDDARG